MKNIKVIISTVRATLVERLVALERKGNLQPVDIGKLLAKKLGTRAKTEAAYYSFFRRGERPIAKSRIPALAEILKTTEELLREINEGFEKEIALEFDPKLEVQTFLKNVPDEIKTLDQFFIWLSTENKRRGLLSKLT